MTEFIIKSTIFLSFMYVFYYMLLKNIRAFSFNRFYLLFSLILSLIIPFVHFKIGIDIPINQNVQNLTSSTTGFIIQGIDTSEQSYQIFTIKNIAVFLYLLISSILLIRLILNLYKITNKIRISEKTDTKFSNIVLVQEKILPYSFFKHIIVNKNEYENGRIQKELIIHEQAHCNQYHSIDILLIEIIKVLFWFNPFIWIYRKEIQLNHEYLADYGVLLNHDMKTYQNLLLNLVFRNNSTYLASNFNYSLTKKRLIMMTKNNSSTKSLARKIAIVPLVLILAFTLSFSQENIPKDSLMNFENEWWFPILQKHDIKLTAFNNFDNVFEMGTTNSIDNRIVTLTDAFFIIRENDGYNILKSTLAYHDLEKNIISGNNGQMETYNLKSNDSSPIEKFEFEKFEFQLNKGKNTWKVENVKGQVKTKK